MNTYYTKFLHVIFWASKGLIITFGMQSLITGQDSFEQIETDLRAVQEKAISAIYKSFPLIPEAEWQHVLKNIDAARKETKKLLLENPEQLHLFQPKLEKDFHYNNVKPFEYEEKKDGNQSLHYLFSLKKESSLNRFELCKNICMASRDIKPGTVTIKSFADKNCTISAYARASYSSSFVNDRWHLVSVSKEQEILYNTYLWEHDFFNAYSDQKYTMRQIDTINHELTHLVEAHGAIRGILTSLIKKYYPHENLDTNKQCINLQKSHELIATVVPLMLSLPNALEQQKQLHFPAPSTIHPSGAELSPWLKRILYCYENYYEKPNHFQKPSDNKINHCDCDNADTGTNKAPTKPDKIDIFIGQTLVQCDGLDNFISVALKKLVLEKILPLEFIQHRDTIKNIKIVF